MECKTAFPGNNSFPGKSREKRLFPGKDVYLESDLRGMYFSPIKTNEKYGSHLLKCKMNKGSGRHSVRVWNKGGLAREPPVSWAGLTVQCRIVLKSLWLQSRAFGVTLEVSDALIMAEDTPQTCPFTFDPN